MTGLNKVHAANCACWGIGTMQVNGFRVRRIVWGLLLAQAEKREGEQIRACTILCERTHRKRREIFDEQQDPQPDSRAAGDQAARTGPHG
jgi:hypothetical protein